jgi:hypothetical protein
MSISRFLAGVLLLPALCTGLAVAHPSSGIVVDEDGQVFFTDNGGDSKSGSLWKIDAKGKLSRVHNAGWHWLALDGKDRFSKEDLKKWFEKQLTMNFDRMPLADSKGALLQADGAPFVVEREGNLCWAKGNLEIARLSPKGEVTLLAPALKETAGKLGGIKGLAAGPDGCLYAACPSAILKIKADGKVITLVHPIALKDVDTDLPEGTPEDQKPFLRGLAVDSQGTVYAAATGCRCVVKVGPDGKVEVVMKAEGPWSPTGVAVHGEDVYVLEYTDPNKGDHDGWLPRVRRLGRDGKVTTLATISKKDRER